MGKYSLMNCSLMAMYAKVDLASVNFRTQDEYSILEICLENVDIDKPVIVENWERIFEKSSKDQDSSKSKNLWILYWTKWRGCKQSIPNRDTLCEIGVSFFASFLSISIFGAIDFYFLSNTKFTCMIPAFGAMAVILFTDLGSRGWMAQPRNAFFGHVLSAVIGCVFRELMRDDLNWISGPLAVSATISLMSLTHTLHPAAGATALTCVYGGQRVTDSGWWFILIPVVSGSIFIILFTLFMNNLSPKRRYPAYWY